jgi:hypothetical protein
MRKLLGMMDRPSGSLIPVAVAGAVRGGFSCHAILASRFADSTSLWQKFKRAACSICFEKKPKKPWEWEFEATKLDARVEPSVPARRICWGQYGAQSQLSPEL